ncbi:MAG TPA: DUF4214 domain-containing protein, partial [Noviherbaspirillum sp.]
MAALYAALLNRAPALQGLAYWVGQLNSGMSLADAAAGILNSVEGQTLYPPSLSNAEFITKLYHVAQNREPDAEGLAFWTKALETSSRGKIAADIVQIVMNYSGTHPDALASQKFFNDKVAAGLTALASVMTKVTQLYVALLDRAPDLQGLDFWVKAAQNSGKSIADIADAMLADTETQALYPAGLSDAQFITRLYNIAQGRDPEPEGLAFWTNAIHSGKSRGEVVSEILDIVADYAGNDPAGLASKKFFNDKVTAALGDFAPAIGGLAPLTEFKLDAYGNVVRRTDYALGAVFADEAAYAAVKQNGNDRNTSTVYDSHGHAAQNIDAEGNSAFASYDAFGRVAKQWQTVTNSDGVKQTAFKQMRYDALGQLVAAIEPDSGNTVVRHGTEYNAFGEIVRKSVNGIIDEYADYDNAGHVWRTNAGDGVDKVMLHDTKGQVTAEIRSADRELKSYDYASPADIVALDKLLRTETRYDLVGHAIAQIRPTQYSTDAANTTESAFINAKVVSRSENVATDDSGFTHVWMGTNRVDLSWMSLAEWGSGDVKVQLDYESNPVRQAFSGDGGTTEYRELVPAQQASYSQIFSADQAETGVTLSWQGDNASAWGWGAISSPAVDNIKHIQVWKKDVKGNWVQIIDRSKQGTFGSFVRIEAPADPNVAVSLKYRVVGSNGEYQTAALFNFGDKIVFNASSLAEGAYEYQVLRQGATEAAPVAYDSGTLSVVSPLKRKQIAQLYVALLNRAPDRGGLSYWISALESGASLADIAKAMLESKEWSTLHPNGLNNEDFIRHFYRDVLNREPDWIGVHSWLNRLAATSGSESAARGKIAVEIINDLESESGSSFGSDAQTLFNNKVDVGLTYAVDLEGNNPATGTAILALVKGNDKAAAIAQATAAASLERAQRQIARLYVGLLNRAPDHDGLNYWVGQLNNGISLGSIAQEMLISEEGKTVYPPTLSDTEFITTFYNIALGRNPEAEGLNFWTNALNGRTRGQVAADMMTALVDYIGVNPVALTSQKLFNNKVAVGLTYALELNGDQPAVARALIANVTAATTAEAAADAAAASTAAKAAAAATAAASAAANAAAAAAAAAATPMEQMRAQITRLYVGLLNRAPDHDGLNYWIGKLSSGTSLTAIAEAMLADKEGTALYPPSLSNTEFITRFYNLALGRDPDREGLDFWSGALNGGYSRGKAVVDIIDAVVNYSGTHPGGLMSHMLFNNKVAVGLTYAVDTAGNDVEAATRINSLVTANDTVAANAAVADAAQAAATAAAQAAAAATATAVTNAAAAVDASNALVTAASANATANAAAAALSPSARMALQIAQLYVGILNRAPDINALNNGIAALSQGYERWAIAQDMLGSPEGQAIYPAGLSSTAFITKFYETALGRTPDAEGLAFWSNAIDAAPNDSAIRGKVIAGIIDAALSYSGTHPGGMASRIRFSTNVANALATVSGEAASDAATKTDAANAAAAAAATAQTVADAAIEQAAAATVAVNQTSAQMRLTIARLYVGILNRAPDLDGLNNGVAALSGNEPDWAIAQNMLDSPEGQALYPASLSSTAFITKFYETALDRTPDLEGLAFWSNAIDASPDDPDIHGKVITSIINAVVNYSGTHAGALHSQAVFSRNVTSALNTVSDVADVAAATAKVTADITKAKATAAAATAVAQKAIADEEAAQALAAA